MKWRGLIRITCESGKGVYYFLLIYKRWIKMTYLMCQVVRIRVTEQRIKLTVCRTMSTVRDR